MTDQLTDNELIAEFMGGIRDKRGAPFYLMPNGIGKLPAHVYGIRELEFDKDWSLLMPVVEKIEAIPDLSLKISITSGYVEIAGLPPYNQKIFKNCSHEGSKIKACRLTVVEFIKWHNNQQKP